uniref:RNA-directed DNA polymerase, eukaryota n=1 Tax=Tanacetum cinerariifolium TaxID=118510 RepID=A0A6L2LQG1_TANCI|nr:RNA-directed DNA polymerase, eukaryota [Tanacetum cinerariifolium]
MAFSKEDQINQISKTVFITNFLDHIRDRYLWGLCKVYGSVVDVYIPFKKSNASKRFAFIRFIKVNNLERLIENLWSIWIGSFHLHANMVHFHREPRQKGSFNNSNADQVNGRGSFSKTMPAGNSKGSFASVLKEGVHIQPVTSTSTLVLDDSCLMDRDFSNSLMCQVKNVIAIPNLQVNLSEEGFKSFKLTWRFKVSIKGDVYWIHAKELDAWVPKFLSDSDNSSSEDGLYDSEEGSKADDKEFNSEQDNKEVEHVYETCGIQEKETIIHKVTRNFEGENQSSDPFNIYTLLRKENNIHHHSKESDPSHLLVSLLNSLSTTRKKVVVQRYSLCWDSNMFIKDHVSSSDYFLAIMGTCTHTATKLLVISVYAPQDLPEKRDLWDYLCSMINRWEGETVVFGDFNEVRTKQERFGSSFNIQVANVFNKCISLAGLVDIPLGGYSYTWAHKSASKMSKLDCFLILEGLLIEFPHLYGLCLDRHLSDHRPIIMFESKLDYGPIPFRMFHSWFSIEGFDKFVKDKWNFMNVDKLIDQVKWDDDILIKRASLTKDLDEINSKEALDVSQKAKIQWLIEGDENSKYFYGILNNDAVFVGEWNISNIKTIVSVLKCFFLASGLKINLVKSKLSGFGVSKIEIDEAAAIVGCSTFSTPFQYLGVKIGAPMSRINSWKKVQDYALWDIIENGNSFKPVAQTVKGSLTPHIPGLLTADEKIQKKNDVKARSMLLMALLNEHLMTFNQYKDANSLFDAITTRFGENDATRKTQKTLMKQMYENFSTQRTKSLDSIFNRLQKIVSQLNMAFVSTPSTSNNDDVSTVFGVSIASSQKTGKKITINGSDTAGYDKAEVECFNYHKMRHFTRECRVPRNQENRTRNQETTRRTVNVEDTSSKAMVAIDGAGFDWSYMADNEAPTNMAFMAFSNSELTGSQINDKSKRDLGYVSYNAILPPHTGRFLPPRIYLSHTGLPEFAKPSVESYGVKPIEVRERMVNGTNHSMVNHSTNTVPKAVLTRTDLKLVNIVRGAKGGKITEKGIIRTGKLDFKDMYFVKELKFNLFSVSQMCDKKNSVLFTDTEYFVLSPDFKLADESHVLLKVPRKNYMYSVDMKNIVSKKVAERRSRTLIEAARTMLADSKLPTIFWAEAVNTACYVENRVLVVKPYFKTPYELFRDLDGDNKDNDGSCKESEIDNQERPNAENSIKDVNSTGPSINTASLNINTASPTVNTVRQSDNFFGADNDMRSLDGIEVDISNISTTYPVPTTPNTRIHKDHSLDNVIGDIQSGVQTRRMTVTTDEQGFISAIYEQKTHENLHSYLFSCFLSQEEPKRITNTLKDPAQGFTQEEGIDYDKVFAPVARIEAIRLFLAYASFTGFLVYHMDVKSAFLYGRIEEEVYVCQPPGFEDPEYPDKVYKVEKAIYGLHQAPRA